MKYWNAKLKNMSEYHPGEQPQNLDEFIKLNTNENPFSPSESVLKKLVGSCNESLKLYPDPKSLSLRETFARQNDIDVENIFVGNGSDEIFTLIFRGLIEADGIAAFPYPSYSLYYTMAEANGINYEKEHVPGREASNHYRRLILRRLSCFLVTTNICFSCLYCRYSDPIIPRVMTINYQYSSVSKLRFDKGITFLIKD